LKVATLVRATAAVVFLRFAAAQDLFFFGDFSCWTRFSARLQLILVASLCAVGFCFRFGFDPPTFFIFTGFRSKLVSWSGTTKFQFSSAPADMLRC
jgi:hypothetical protein